MGHKMVIVADHLMLNSALQNVEGHRMTDDPNKPKPQRLEPQRLKGFRDLMPATMFVRQHVINTLKGIFEMHGFAPLETPSLEYASTLEGKYGEDERLIYKFEDKGK